VDDDVGEAHGRAKLPQSRGKARGLFLKLAKTRRECSVVGMQRVATFLLVFLLLARAGAEQWISDEFRCSLSLPEGEAWMRGAPTRVSSGEMIYTSSHPESKQTISVIVIPRIPSNDLGNPAVVSRIMENLVGLGYAVTGHAPVKIGEADFLEFIATKKESAAIEVAALARATMRENTIYLALTSAPGDEEKTQDKYFRRVIDTFSLANTTAQSRNPLLDPLFHNYRITYIACAVAVGALLFMSIFVVFFSRRRAHR
jgi:hypothetical protein